MFHRLFVSGITVTLVLTSAGLSSASAVVIGRISDVIDYQLLGAANPVQFLYDDILPLPEFQQVRPPITTVVNPGIAAPREVWFMRPIPGVDGDSNPNDLSGISDIIAIKPVAGNLLELHFWSDDPTVTAAQFRANLGLAGAPAGMVVEDGRGHDVTAILFGNNSPFQHLIVASDTLAAGILPGVITGGGGGGTDISETFVFRDPTGAILNQGGHGAALWDAPGFPESYNDVYTIAGITNGNIYRSMTIGFTEGVFPDQTDIFADRITDTVTLRVLGGDPITATCTVALPCTLMFGEWSEDPNQPHPAPDQTFDETVPHPPLADLFGVRGLRVGTDANGNPIILNQIDFKSDPPADVPEPGTLLLLGTGVLGLGTLVSRKKRSSQA